MLLTVLLHDYYIEFKVPEQVLYNTISTLTTITRPITITNTTRFTTIFSIPTSDRAEEATCHLACFFKTPGVLQITHGVITTCLLI